MAFPPEIFVSSLDQKGLAITVEPNEVAFLYPLSPVNTEGSPMLLRLTVRASSADAAVALAALRGNLNDMNEVDGSIATHIPANASGFVNEERRIVLVYEPDHGNLITPVIQVAATGQAGAVTVYVDKLEIIKLDEAEFGSKSNPAPTPTPASTPSDTIPATTPDTRLQTITVPLPNLPEGAKPLEMVLIPAGTFLMGSPGTDPDRHTDEEPQREVTLTKPYYIGKYEVTQAQYLSVMGSAPSFFKDNPNNPVDQVNWFDCARFCNRLSQNEGWTPVYNESDWSTKGNASGYRLPTEAEWEYACRAGTTTRFYWGDDLSEAHINDYAWWSGNTQDKTYEVGLKWPNAWGLFDMSGNLYEWCEDWYGFYPPGAAVDPVGQKTSMFNRTYRGGSWFSSTDQCRSASRIQWRGTGPPESGVLFLGFRIVRSLYE
ncbi:MAG: formylglycine-generating enzyme family protein [bacterium]